MERRRIINSRRHTEEPELAELKCKMIFRIFSQNRERYPTYHETENAYIKTEDRSLLFFTVILISS